MVFLNDEQKSRSIDALKENMENRQQKTPYTIEPLDEKEAEAFNKQCILDEEIEDALHRSYAFEHPSDSHVAAIKWLSDMLACSIADATMQRAGDRCYEERQEALRYALYYLQTVPMIRWLPVTDMVPGHEGSVMIAMLDEDEMYNTTQAHRKVCTGSVFYGDDGHEYTDVPLWAPVIQPPQFARQYCPDCLESTEGPVFEDELGKHMVCMHCGSSFNLTDCEDG